MKKITEKELLDLGFRKEHVPTEESGDNPYDYFGFEINNEIILISCSSDELINGGYVVEFFDFPEIGYYDNLETLTTLIKILQCGVKK